MLKKAFLSTMYSKWCTSRPHIIRCKIRNHKLGFLRAQMILFKGNYRQGDKISNVQSCQTICNHFKVINSSFHYHLLITYNIIWLNNNYTSKLQYNIMQFLQLIICKGSLLVIKFMQVFRNKT